MKKTLLLSLVISLLMSGAWTMAGPAGQVLASTPAESAGEWAAMREGFGAESGMPVFHAGGNLVIDGQLGDWDAGDYSGIALPSSPAQVQLSGWGGEEDLSLTARFAYDEEHFYLAASVTDNVYAAVPNDSMWSGDSIQLAFGSGARYGPEYGFALVDGVSQVWSWVGGEGELDKDAIAFTATRNGNKTIYEAAIPWRAIFAREPDGESPVQFSLLVNDNDGAGRRGWIEWTDSIAQVKRSGNMSKLYLVPLHDNWSLWLDTKQEIRPGEEVPYTLTAVNYSNEMRALTLSSPLLGLERQAVLAPGAALRLTSTFAIPNSGDYSLKVDAIETAAGVTRTLELPVTAIVTAEELSLLYDDLESRLPQLQTLMEQAALRGIAIDYERVDVTVLQNFLVYGREDAAKGRLQRSNYVLNELEAMLAKSMDSLEAYLSGDQEARAVPRYTTGNVDIENYAFTGTTRTASTGEVEQGRPIFFNGYGHFNQVRSDMSKFQDYGVNIVQVETGPSRVVLQKEGYIPKFASNKSGGVSGEYIVDDTVSRTGSRSLKMVNRTPKAPNVFLRVWQNLALKPNTSYTFKAWVKADGLVGQNAWFPGGSGWLWRTRVPAGTYDWTEVSGIYTTDASTVSMDMMFVLENTGTIWIDDITVTEQGSTENLVRNSGFEEFPQSVPVEGDYVIVTDRLQQDVISTLQAGEAYDIAVNVLLSPHYFPEWVLQQYPEIRNSSNKGSLKYNIYHPKAKEVIETYLRAVIPLIKDYHSLHSLTLSNEPVYYANLIPALLPDWQQYLRGVYAEDIGEVNRVYGTDYTSFQEVSMPAVLEASPEGYDYMLFNNLMFSQWHKWMADIIHEIAPEIPLHAKVMTDFELNLERGTDLEQFSAFSQINGNDAYNLMGARPNSFRDEAAVYDMQRSFNKAPVFNSEYHFIRDGDTNYIKDQAIHARALYWQGAVHGRSASTAWVWERTYDSSSPFEGSVLHRPDVVSAIGRTNLDLNRLAYEVKALQETPSRAAILYSTPSSLYNNDFFAAMGRGYEALSYSGQSIRFVSEGQAARGGLDGFKLLLIPAATHVTEAALEGIADFVEQGGKIVMMDARSLGRNEHNEAHSPAKVQAATAQAIVVGSGITGEQLRSTLLPLLEQEGMTPVMLKGPESPQPVYGVEWRYATRGGKLLVNAINLTSRPQTVSLEVYGQMVQTPVQDLISGQMVNVSSLELAPNTPYLLEVPSFSVGPGGEAALAAPGRPELSHNNGHDTGLLDGEYEVRMNLWWGNNADSYKLYENGVLIDSQTLVDQTPNPQTAATSIAGKGDGIYRYYAELSNARGTSRSDEITVTVSNAAPSKPVLSADNWDGDGSYTLTMNMWWGTNGTAYRLYENGDLIDTQVLEQRTPQFQSAGTTIAGRQPGSYEYRCELVNAAGSTTSDSITVKVLHP